MALFRTRNRSDNKSEPASRKKSASIDTVESLRTRARQRLIGSALLLLVGIITFTLLFDNKPRPIPSDIEIIIPDKDKVAPISAPTQPPIQAPRQTSPQASPSSTASIAAGSTAAEPANTASTVKPAQTHAAGAKPVQASSSLNAKEELVTAKPAVKPEVKAEPKAAVKLEPKIEPKSSSKTNIKPNADDGAKAKAILEGKVPKASPANNPSNSHAAASTDRYIVQVGVFADAVKAREVRLKLERVGLKTYTNVAKTPEGTRRTRVRVGPFPNRAEADKAAEKIKKLDLPATILTL